MKKIIKSNAKINLGLNITGKLPNGYHTLDMVMAPVDLYDELEIEFSGQEGTLEISTNKSSIPTGKENILYKIYDAFYKSTEMTPQGIRVHLEKKIPHEAGLGGGSSNGASFMKELNIYHGNPLTADEMVEISKNIGADIPFFIINKTCRVKGIGEKLQRVENNLNCDILMIKPNFGIRTADAYANFSKLTYKKDADIEKILMGLKENKLSDVIEGISNHLEQGLLSENEDLKIFKNLLTSLEEVEFFMSGSGSTYYALLEKNDSQTLYEKFKRRLEGCEVHLCSFL